MVFKSLFDVSSQSFADKNIRVKMEFWQFFIYMFINYWNRLYIDIIMRVIERLRSIKIDVSIFKLLKVGLDLLETDVTFGLVNWRFEVLKFALKDWKLLKWEDFWE